jgi:hypothetical protein
MMLASVGHPDAAGVARVMPAVGEGRAMTPEEVSEKGAAHEAALTQMNE